MAMMSAISSLASIFWVTTTGLLSLCVATCAFASDNAPASTPNPSIFQLQHTGWTERDGAPASINDIAQAPDGSLWLGSSEGLYHFDGFSFERVPSIDGDSPAPIDVYALHASSNGDLWIGTSYHGAILFRNGEAKRLPDFERISPNTTIGSLAEDLDGNIWAGTAQGVQRFDRSRWHSVGREWGLPERARVWLHIDDAGAIWVGAFEQGVFRLKRGSRRFERLAGVTQAYQFSAQSPSGQTWFSTSSGICLWAAHQSAPSPPCVIHNNRSAPPPFSAYSELTFDRRGNLWMASSKNVGIQRLQMDALRDFLASHRRRKVESFTERDGLTSDTIRSIFPDRRDGSIWVGTEHGLDHFRESPFLPEYPNPGGVDFGVQSQKDGQAWIGSRGSGLWISSPDGKARAITLLGANINSLLPAHRGGLWFATDLPVRIAALNSGRMTSLPLTPELRRQVGVQSIVEDKSGALWVSFVPYGLAKWEDGHWIRDGGLTGLPEGWVVILNTGADGRIWAGYLNGEVAVIDGTSVRRFAAKDGLNIGPVSAILSEQSDCWLAGVNGLVRFDGRHFQLLSEVSNGPFSGITGIVKARNGDLWLNAWDGVRHIAAAELARAEKDPGFGVHSDLYDRVDGMPGAPPRIRPFPTAVLGTDGRIWFGLRSGVVSVDPQDPSLSYPAPPVSIIRAIADGRQFNSTSIQLAPRARNLEIDYTAVSLSRSSRVRFRYKLEGVDTGWQSAGARRQAFYSNLPPGDYQFSVSASNGDDLWNEAGATMNIVIPPAFYQTTWFRVLCVAAFLVLLWGLYQLRLHQIQQQLNAGLEERVGERTRIARELHDTLLQSLHGLMFQFQAARNLLPRSPERAVQILDEAIFATEQAIAESRDAINDLRPETVPQGDLAQLLKSVGEEMGAARPTGQNAPRFDVIVEGEPQTLSSVVQHEVYSIAREVIRNAFHHANAHRIEVEIRYDKDQLRVRLRDDGKGIDRAVLEHSRRSGHWGLPGVRERAQRIGSQLDFWSEAGVGTEVELTVPIGVADARAHNGLALKLFRKVKSREQSL